MKYAIICILTVMPGLLFAASGSGISFKYSCPNEFGDMVISNVPCDCVESGHLDERCVYTGDSRAKPQTTYYASEKEIDGATDEGSMGCRIDGIHWTDGPGFLIGNGVVSELEIPQKWAEVLFLLRDKKGKYLGHNSAVLNAQNAFTVMIFGVSLTDEFTWKARCADMRGND